MSACTGYAPANWPQGTRSCRRCGLLPARHGPALRPRDFRLEAELMDTAAKAADCFDADGNGDDRGLSAFADSRAWPGGVRASVDGVREASEEFADARNYLVWEIERIYGRVIEGEPESLDRYSQLFGALSALVVAWHALHRVPS